MRKGPPRRCHVRLDPLSSPFSTVQSLRTEKIARRILKDTRGRHRRIMIGNIDIFKREAGPKDAPVVLLPKNYACSS